MSATIRRLALEEHARAVEFYRSHGDLAVIDPAATILVVMVDARIAGIVRLVVEHQVLVLRGMHLLAELRGRGVGRELLRRTVGAVGVRACYCLPYAHLLRFYGECGFVPLREGEGPPHLLQRLVDYERLNKPPMRLVCRPASEHGS